EEDVNFVSLGAGLADAVGQLPAGGGGVIGTAKAVVEEWGGLDFGGGEGFGFGDAEGGFGFAEDGVGIFGKPGGIAKFEGGFHPAWQEFEEVAKEFGIG